MERIRYQNLTFVDRLKATFALAAGFWLGMQFAPASAFSVEAMVYNISRPVDLGDSAEAPQKDYYVNLGKAQGLVPGSKLEVFRRTSTYDLVAEKLYRDVTLPVARLKVIHVDDGAAVARLEQLAPPSENANVTPKAVMIGDLVKIQ